MKLEKYFKGLQVNLTYIKEHVSTEKCEKRYLENIIKNNILYSEDSEDIEISFSDDDILYSCKKESECSVCLEKKDCKTLFCKENCKFYLCNECLD